MGYRTLIDKSLTLAFNLLKDLAVNITLIRKTNTTFDFSTADVTKGTVANTIIKAVILDGTKTSPEHNANRKQIIFKSKGIDDITMYDSILLENETWKFGPIISNSGYIISAEIFKEV